MGRGIDIVAKVEGAAQLRRALRAKSKEFLDAMADELPKEGQSLMSAANALAPRASGALIASSGVTSVVQPAKGRVRVTAGYADEKAPAVHEGVHWGVHVEGTRGFKWFERAFNSFEGGFTERIVARLRRIVSGGGE